MGTNPTVWVEGIRHTTTAAISDLSGPWSDRLRPFVEGFLIARKATKEVWRLLCAGKRLVFVEGTPLIGKSNCLRELSLNGRNEQEPVVLFLDAETSCVVQQVADTLSRNLDWPITREEAREWLKRISYSSGPRLVIAVDGIGPRWDDFQTEVSDLVSDTFGPNLSVVLELDDVVADRVVVNSTGTKKTFVGRRATRVRVLPLDDTEFDGAAEVLWKHRIGIRNGGQWSLELRLPWVLRAVAAPRLEAAPIVDTMAGIPPLLSLDMIRIARDVFDDVELRREFQAIATGVLRDAQDNTRSISLVLQSTAAFVVKRKTLEEFLERSEIHKMVQRGLLKPLIHESNEPILVPRIPELVASEISRVLGAQLPRRATQNVTATAGWLTTLAASLPFGDIIAAHALIDTGHDLPWPLIGALMERKPREQMVREGTEAAMFWPGLGTLRMTFEAGGVSVRHGQAEKHFIPFELGQSLGVTYSDMHAWLILSHLAVVPMVVLNSQDESDVQRFDPYLLLEVAKCPMVLRAPSADPSMNQVQVYEFPGCSVVAPQSGIIEPITLSLFQFLVREGVESGEWIEEAAATGSVPILGRLHIALHEMIELADSHYQSSQRVRCTIALRQRLPPLQSAENESPLHRRPISRTTRHQVVC